MPLYLVVAAGALAYAVPRLAGRERAEGGRAPGLLEWALAASLALYAIQASYSDDFGHALENVVFFYVPFALLFVARGPRGVDAAPGPRCAWACSSSSPWRSSGVGFVEYATRHLFLNPKVIASNQLEDYFRVNSLFFDPNIYGRFLALVMLLLVGWLLWARRQRDVVACALLLAVLWGGLVLTFSQSSFTALLVGLAILGAMRWSVRWALILSAARWSSPWPSWPWRPEPSTSTLGNSKSADKATSGRYDLIKGGLKLFRDAPLVGQGSGSFARDYRRAEHVSPERAASASHTIPVTVAAEQGVIGLLVYLALLAAALGAPLPRGRGACPSAPPSRRPSSALLAHSLMYAAFLEDPLTWTLLGAGTAMALWAAVREPAPA